MGGLYRVTEWISRIAFSNILWAICSVPFLFMGVMKMIMWGSGAGGPNEQITLNWAMGILAPFTVFPATAALFTVVRKWVMGNSDVSTFRTFFQVQRKLFQEYAWGINLHSAVCCDVRRCDRIHDANGEFQNRRYFDAGADDYFVRLHV